MYILDTNIVSELYKRIPNPNVQDWVRRSELAASYLTSITIGEIRSGIEQKRASEHFARHVIYLEDMLTCIEEAFKGRILGFDKDAAHVWGRITAYVYNNPVDAQIAAIALVHKAALVTRDKGFAEIAKTADALGLQLSLLDPFAISGA